MMISQYDKDMCCLYIAEGMSYIWQQRGNQELSRILEAKHPAYFIFENVPYHWPIGSS